jgi:site-specific recombinase XerC
MPPFNITRAYNIYARTLEKYTLLVMAKAHKTRTIPLARQRRDNLPSTRMMRRINQTIAPLFMLDQQAVLSKSQMMERRLAKAKIEHVGKHIPTTASN